MKIRLSLTLLLFLFVGINTAIHAQKRGTFKIKKKEKTLVTTTRPTPKIKKESPSKPVLKKKSIPIPSRYFSIKDIYPDSLLTDNVDFIGFEVRYTNANFLMKTIRVKGDSLSLSLTHLSEKMVVDSAKNRLLFFDNIRAKKSNGDVIKLESFYTPTIEKRAKFRVVRDLQKMYPRSKRPKRAQILSFRVKVENLRGEQQSLPINSRAKFSNIFFLDEVEEKNSLYTFYDIEAILPNGQKIRLTEFKTNRL